METKKHNILVSLMCMDFLDIKEQLKILEEEMDGYHIDIMDGHFCKNITLSPDFAKAIRPAVKKPMDVHLMTTDPSDWLDPCIEAGVDMISPHAETINTNAYRTMQYIAGAGKKVGVTLNPATALSYIEHYLNRIDVMTIMTVDVGFAGQKFIPEMLDKIRQAKALREEKGYHYRILIDGSCNKTTYEMLLEAGADDFIVGGSGLFSLHEDLREACKLCKAQFQEAVDKVEGRERAKNA